MLMINMKKLDQLEDKYYYEGKLFTGVGFETFEEKIEEVCQFKNGVNVGIYRSQYFPNNSTISQIDIDYIEFTGEYLDSYAFYKNKRFSGIAYELEGEQEFCLGRHLIDDGVTVVSRRWYPSGEKESLKLDRKDIVQIFEWFKDGSLKKIRLYSRENRQRLIDVTLSEAQQLNSVWIEKNYFEWLVKYKSQIEYDYFESVNSFEDYTVATNLSLINSGVNDVVFYSIAANDGLMNLCKIIVFNTSLTGTAILELASIKTLKQITISEEKRDLVSIAKELKRKRPDCFVKLNEQKITLE
jgi:hypothetical protein